MLLGIMHVIPLSLFLSPSATALTVDNVVRQLKGITWRTLCDTECEGKYGLRGVLYIPRSQWRKIENKYATEDQRRNAAVQFWLLSDPYASWRRLIRRLDLHEKHMVADQIRPYAEKLTGMLGSSM